MDARDDHACADSRGLGAYAACDAPGEPGARRTETNGVGSRIDAVDRDAFGGGGARDPPGERPGVVRPGVFRPGGVVDVRGG